MPEACANCRAFLIEGRPDCPFCGSIGGSTQPAGAAPGPGAPFGGPGDPLGSPVPPPGPKWSGVNLALYGIIAVCVLAFGALVVRQSMAGNGDEAAAAEQEDTSADAATDAAEAQVDKLRGVCADKPEPIEEAAAYKAGPGMQGVELMVFPHPEDGGSLYWSNGIPEEFGSQQKLGQHTLELDKVELVACLHTTELVFRVNCDMVDDETGAGLSMPLFTTKGTMVVREAATGKEVRRDQVAGQRYNCPLMTRERDKIILDAVDGAADVLMRTVTANRLASLPIAEQVAATCGGKLRNVPALAGRSLDAVTIAVADEHGPYEPLGPTSPVVIPPGRTFVAPDRAGTVLCIRLQPQDDGMVSPDYTAISLATGSRSGSRGGTDAALDAQGRLHLELAGKWGIEGALANERGL